MDEFFVEGRGFGNWDDLPMRVNTLGLVNFKRHGMTIACFEKSDEFFAVSFHFCGLGRGDDGGVCDGDDEDVAGESEIDAFGGGEWALCEREIDFCAD